MCGVPRGNADFNRASFKAISRGVKKFKASNTINKIKRLFLINGTLLRISRAEISTPSDVILLKMTPRVWNTNNSRLPDLLHPRLQSLF